MAKNRDVTNRRQRARDDASHQKMWRKIQYVAAASIVGGLTVGLLTICEPLFTPRSERLIALYKTHGCSCAGQWQKSLEAAGFKVSLYEPETLNMIRGKLQTPARFGGCHVAEYMDYFIEGHVPIPALVRLSKERPPAIGVAMEDDWNEGHSKIEEELGDSSVLLVESSGGVKRWPLF